VSEKRLLASCIKSRTAYDRIADHLEDVGLTEQGKMILTHVDRYYTRDAQARAVDPDLLMSGIARELPNPKHHRVLGEIVASVMAEDVSPENVVADYLATKREKVGNQLATMLAAGRPPGEVAPLVERYQELLTTETIEKEETRVLCGESVTKLVAARNREGGLIQVFPQALNERLDGGLLRGHHMVVFARPEVGKTLFAVNAIYGFLKQGLRTLYVGNEDPIEDIVLRVVSRLSGLTRHEVLDDPETADRIAREKGYNNLVLASLTPGTIKEIEALVIEHKPAVVLTDQLRNLQVGQENFTRQLETAAQGVRTIGKRHGALMVSFTQAGDSASGKSILDMGDVDSSNTGIPAQADVMVGIGMSREDETMGRRVLSLPKNKSGGNHDSFPVRVDLQRSKMASA